MKTFYGNWALVAGAAEGIGEAFSQALARRRMNLIMVDRNEEKLQLLSNQLTTEYGIETITSVMDLSGEDAWQRCLRLTEGLDCNLLVYVPAYSVVRPFLDNTPGDLDSFVNLNCRTPLKLVHSFGSRMKENKKGGIILMSSLAGIIGPQYVSVYAATKAFNIRLGEALYHEFREYGVDILVCCAGITDTPAYWSGNPYLGPGHPDLMKAEDVAEYGLKNLGRKAICIPGWKNRLNFFILTRLLPGSLASSIVNKAMTKFYPEIST